MIKQLISDLAYDNITLSQGLTRAKIMATKVKNQLLKDWLKNELSGYQDVEDEYMPPYRTIECRPFIKHRLPYGREGTSPVMLHPNDDNEHNRRYLYTVTFYEPISSVERHLADIKGQLLITISVQEAQYLSRGDRYQQYVVGGFREVSRAAIQNILDQTKQKLLDILLELDTEFPNLQDEFAPSPADAQTVQNIVTNNIYGNANPINVAAGNNVSQRGSN